MISPQPIQLWRYLGFKKHNLSSKYKRLFYLSYEDALWDLLNYKNVKNGSPVLLPEFFCDDVENNIKNRGYKISHYKIKSNLQVDLTDFSHKIKSTKPAVVIIFHPVGIKSNVNINLIDRNIIVIEDCVHKIINLEEIAIKKQNHFIIDSLRKVLPLQGSNLIGLQKDLNFNPPKITQSLIYNLKVHILWLFMLIFWNIGYYNKAEKLMKKGYDLIGDSIRPSSGFSFFKYIFQFININEIKKIKSLQIEIYKKNINTDIHFIKNDYGNMRGYPVKVTDQTLNMLRDNNLQVRYELFDSEWGKKNKVIYLPLGPYISYAKIHKICEIYQLASSTQV